MWGWKPQATTEYRYGDDGRLVSSVTVTEPEWDQLQVDYLIALELYEADIGPHGFRMSEATSKDADPSNRDRKYRFVADEIPTVDFAAKTRDDAMDRYYKKWPDANRNGHLWAVRREDL